MREARKLWLDLMLDTLNKRAFGLYRTNAALPSFAWRRSPTVMRRCGDCDASEWIGVEAAVLSTGEGMGESIASKGMGELHGDKAGEGIHEILALDCICTKT